jgi:four helix bundle protein
MNSKQKRDNIEKRSRDYALSVIHLLNKLPKSYMYQTMGRQLLRSATSVGANIVEAQAGSSKRDFANFLSHALKSANESRFWLSLLRDSCFVCREEIDRIIKETNELANILGASILTLKGKRKF